MNALQLLKKLIAIDSQGNNTNEKIVLTYRAYLSDDLTEPQAVQRLQVESITYTRGVASFSAVAPKLNITRTGELYTFSRFPMLRGFL